MTMATYTYRAIDANENILAGRLLARDETDLEYKLTRQGLTLIEAVKAGLFDRTERAITFGRQDLVNFSYFLHMIITSGLSIMNGLGDLMENQENGKIAQVAGLVYTKVEAGMSLSAAMQEYPAVFPDYYVRMIAAGEASGKLEKMLTDLMRYLEWQMNFNKTVRSAIVYPAMVLGAVTLLITALFTFVFPRLVTILIGLRAELPLPTKVLIAVAGFVSNYLVFIVLGIAAAGALVRLWLKTYAGRRAFDAFLLSLPLVGQLLRKIDLSRYCKTLATLHAAGLNVEHTFMIAASVVRNVVLAEGLTVVTESVVNGEGIGPSMMKSGIFPSLVIEMVSIGEKTGNLDVAVQRVSDMFDKEVPETLKKVFSYFEPLIIVLLGVLVLGVLLSVFLPIYKIVGGVHGR
jgi:type II secretory pathway component PulF